MLDERSVKRGAIIRGILMLEWYQRGSGRKSILECGDKKRGVLMIFKKGRQKKCLEEFEKGVKKRV